MRSTEDFDEVRADPDPIRRARRATALMAVYQQRSTELARLRRAAIEEAHDETGRSYSDIASALGITKGRVTQIRGSAPNRERAFFGVGPVSVAVPLRAGTDTRPRTYLDATDLGTRAEIQTLLGTLALVTDPIVIEPEQDSLPTGDTVVVCGPKSAPVAAALLDTDPVLGMLREQDRWWIIDRRNGQRWGSPFGDPTVPSADVGYLSRRRDGDRIVVHIAGIHSPGSAGVAHHLAHHVHALYRATGDQSFSMVIGCEFDGHAVTGSAVLSGPHHW